jgi:hypothetical protein
MTMHSTSTDVTAAIVNADEIAAFADLRKSAIARLGRDRGLRMITVSRVGDQLAGTFAVDWDDGLVRVP